MCRLSYILPGPKDFASPPQLTLIVGIGRPTCLFYFRFDDECRQYVAHCNRVLKAVSEFVFHELTSVGVKIVQPKGGFYMMPDFEVNLHV